MIKTSAETDKARVTDTIVLGFAADPVIRWFFPEAGEFLSTFPTLMGLFGGNAFEHGSAYHLDNYSGAALWLPPDVHPDEDGLIALFEEKFSGPRLEEIFSLFEQMDGFHPDKPFWHLAFIAVDPGHQRRGHGSVLMEHTLEPCDRDKKLAYLESTNPSNLSLYQRYGFELIGEIQAGSSPPLFPMVREPR